MLELKTKIFKFNCDKKTFKGKADNISPTDMQIVVIFNLNNEIQANCSKPIRGLVPGLDYSTNWMRSFSGNS